MKTASIIAAVCALVISAGLSEAMADDDDARFPQNATFTTQAITTLAIEGLTGDSAGNFYTTGRELDTALLCPVWRITGATRTVVGNVPNSPACNPSGITFDRFGKLYIADAARGGVVWTLTPNATTPPTAVEFATGVPGTNGLAFDGDGNLWTGDGTTGQGRVWRIAPTGGACEPSFTGCKEVFRIQRMANSANVGRQASTLQPPPVAANPQPLVANGVAFDRHGDLFIADTARGAIWKAEFDHSGNLKSRTKCDTTFPDNTLCLDNIFVAHPYLEGADGIALDRAGNIWVAANERNAIVVVTRKGGVVEVFRNPVNAAGLRNSADATVGNNHILEFPTSPFLSGTRFCTSQSDGDRRDNSPRAAGEINAGNTDPVARGKISCMDQEVGIPGMPLPVQ